MKSISINLFRQYGRLFSFNRYLSTEINILSEFEKAKNRLESSSIEVDNETKLKMYALFKQATKGVCSVPKPGLTDFIGRAKWTAWSSLGQMSQIDAQKQYITTVEKLVESSSKTITKSENEIQFLSE